MANVEQNLRTLEARTDAKIKAAKDRAALKCAKAQEISESNIRRLETLLEIETVRAKAIAELDSQNTDETETDVNTQED